jgi:predicted nucleotidyltransferase
MMTIDDIIKASGLHKFKVHNIYVFGSRVYETHSDDSDWDIVVVANNSVEAIEIKSGDLNIHIYTPKKFQQDLDWHKPKNIECFFAPQWAKIQERIRFDFNLNPIKLRHATLHTTNQSWKKCKSKLEAGDYPTGIKSLFHSIRIPIFSTQLLEFNKIDFFSSNYVWDKISQHYPQSGSDWCHYSDLPSPNSYKESTFLELEAEFGRLRKDILDNFINTINQKIK